MARTRDWPVPLPRAFYDREPEIVARELLGKLLIRAGGSGRMLGRIVETEAYLATGDPASHSYSGLKRRNASMFGAPGHAYVYAIHSRWCLNAVTQPEGTPSAILIRAVEPLEGLDLMADRRGTDNVRDLARGPARLCEAFGIDRALDGHDLTCAEELWIAADGRDEGSVPESRLAVGPRVGVTSAHDLPLRYYLADSPFVSRRPRTPRPR